MEDRVSKAFAKLKWQNSSYELKSIKGRHYVYISFSKWDAEARRSRKVSIYKGKISEEGMFTAVRRHKRSRQALGVAAEPNGRQAALSAQAELHAEEPRMRESSKKYENTLLTALSMNGRISLPVLSEMVGLSVNATAWQVASLEKRYGIRYLPEIDVGKFGYMPFLITVKFSESVPSSDRLKEILEKEPRIQLAALTTGDFDLIVYLLARTNAEAIAAVIFARTALSEFESVWSTVSLNEVYGFIPVRNEFIGLLKEKGELLERESAVLEELNTDGSIEFVEIDKRHSFDRGRAQYSYHKLRNEGKIRRITMTMQNLPVKYVGVIMVNMVNRRLFGINKIKLLTEVVDEPDNIHTNKFAASYDLASPDGFLFCVPVIDSDSLDSHTDKLMSLNLGIRLSKLTTTNVIVGRFCYRHFDNAYSMQQKILEEDYKKSKMARKNYEKTGKERQKEEYLGDIRGSKFAEKNE